MTDIIIAIISTIGALAIFFAALGLVRMPDFYLRLSVTVKAATLGVDLLLLCTAILFPDISVTTKAIAIICFRFISAPVAAEMIARTSYSTSTRLWKGTMADDLAGMYNKETHTFESDIQETESHGSTPKGQIAEDDKETR